jgi:D-alanine-D-alanine ligase
MRSKKFLILVDRIFNKHRILAESLKKADPRAEVFLEKTSEVTFFLSGEALSAKIQGIDLKDFDFVFFRRSGREAGNIILYLDECGVPFIDEGLRTTTIRGDKLTMLERLAIAGLPIIPTFYCSHEDVDKYFAEIAEKLGIPVIVKEIHEHYLKGIYVVRSKDDFKKVVKKYKRDEKKRFVFQPFMDFKEEYRLLVLGGEVRSINLRTARNFEELKVGYVDEDEIEKYLPVEDFPEKLKSLAVRAAGVLGLQVAGVDLCVEKGSGKVFVLEVNRGPDFNYDTALSPEFPELIKYLARKLTH